MTKFTSLQETLTNFATSNNMSLRELAQVADMTIEYESLLKQHNSPISQNEKDKRWRTRLPNGKQIVKTRKEDLENAVVDYYRTVSKTNSTETLNNSSSLADVAASQTDCTLKTLYPQWYAFRKCVIHPNTFAKDINNWNKYIANHAIADIPLKQLRKSTLKAWSSQLITKYSMKKKYYANIKAVLNSLLDFAVDEELIDINPFLILEKRQ